MSARLIPPEGFASRLERECAPFKLAWSEERRRATFALLERYATLVATWNERVDLTAARSADELVDLLFADALAISTALPIDAEQAWCDVGSGVGAPGIPLALVAPTRMCLVEPREKRVAFLRTAVGTLDRSDIRIERCRSQSLASKSTDFAMSRATLPPAEWLREGGRLARRGVWVLLAKAELPPGNDRQIIADLRYQWPLTGVARRAVCVGNDGATVA
ncbi:MAG TPA: RsmG family class I SAM-dependent methyltransferase [Polyangiaceae bacterium]